MSQDLHIVTGAFSFTGRYISRCLLGEGHRVRTLTASADRSHVADSKIEVAPFDFDNAAQLTKSLQGARALFNTYWIRFPYRGMTFEKAVENTKTLVKCALEAGVTRFVHLSITNPAEDSPLPYFRGKALVERAIMESGISYAILRPALVFGEGDILVNNIAWFLRRFPVFPIPGDGEYKVAPIYLEDLAKIAVDAAQRPDNLVIDTLGPQVFSYKEFVGVIATSIGARARIVCAKVPLMVVLSRVMGFFLRDIVLTRDEIAALMANLLTTDSQPRGLTRLGDWLVENRKAVGVRYRSELARHYRGRKGRDNFVD